MTNSLGRQDPEVGSQPYITPHRPVAAMRSDRVASSACMPYGTEGVSRATQQSSTLAIPNRSTI